MELTLSALYFGTILDNYLDVVTFDVQGASA